MNIPTRERVRAFRQRHGPALTVSLPGQVHEDIADIMRFLGLKSQRAVIAVAIDVLKQTIEAGALQKAKP